MDKMEDFLLKWEVQEKTGLKNAPNILGVDELGVYYLGRFVNGEFFVPERLAMSGFRRINIIKYAELPEPEEQDK